jgi:hypothetical protein
MHGVWKARSRRYGTVAHDLVAYDRFQLRFAVDPITVHRRRLSFQALVVATLILLRPSVSHCQIKEPQVHRHETAHCAFAAIKLLMPLRRGQSWSLRFLVPEPIGCYHLDFVLRHACRICFWFSVLGAAVLRSAL